MAAQLPTFSVVVPTWNRPQALRHCLQSFCELDYAADRWELIVVNDGGEDSFTAVDDELQAALPLRLMTVPHGGPARARNAGAAQARGEFLAFTDDDCRVFPDWLRSFAAGFADVRWDALGGRAISPFTQNMAERAWQHLTDFLYTFMRDDEGNGLLLISNNVAYRRETFMALGGFDVGFPLAAAEDMELSYRLLRYGYRQRYYPAAKIWHYHHLTTWGHLRQQFRYGRGGYFFQQALLKRPSPRLQALYEHEWFYPSLWRSLRRERVPLPAAFLVFLAQRFYQLGLRYQGVLTFLQKRGWAVDV